MTLNEFPTFHEFSLRVGSHLYHAEAEKHPPEKTLSYWLEEPQNSLGQPQLLEMGLAETGNPSKQRDRENNKHFCV